MEPRTPLSDYERERGKPRPGLLHSLTQMNLIGQLAGYGPHFQVLSELTLRLGDRDLTPDLSVYRDLEVDFTRDETRMTGPPLLAIEISSPTQGIQDLVDKAWYLMEHGVESCWIVQPPLRTITVFTPDMDSTTYSSGVVPDLTTEIEVDLADVFSVE
ncbi:MAG: Uma2 family endonuclease [Bacteroidetes bacterium QS_4_64_154]|nr:MAG: Uma2 family endonuclease [Bacteroidetes bacterium QS_4_64_154]